MANWQSCKRRKLVLTSAMLGTAIAGAPAHAQEQNEAAAARGGFEEIVVTAQRREERLLDTPVSVSAFGSEELDKIGVNDTADVVGFVPNLEITPVSGTQGSAGLFIRGLGNADPQLALDARVGNYFDGVYLARMNSAIISLLDVERIEVLRGPQGTLFGRNTTGGAVNITTRKPSGAFEGNQRLEVGNFGYFRSVTKIDLPQFGGLSLGGSYLISDFDGTVKNTAIRPGALDRAGRSDTEAFRIAARYQPSDTIRADISFYNVEMEGTPVAVQLSGAALPSLQPFVFNDRQDELAIDLLREITTETSLATLNVEWDIAPEAMIRSITGYAEQSSIASNDQDGSERIVPDVGTQVNNYGTADQDQEQFSQELQLAGQAFDQSVDYIAGLYYFNEKSEETSSAFTGLLPFSVEPSPNGYPGATVRNYTTDYTTYAAFGQVTWRPGGPEGRLGVTGGLRYSRDEREASQSLTPGFARIFGERDFSHVDYTVGVDYRLREDLNAYAKVSSGYNAGGFNIRDVSILPDGRISFEEPFDSETLTSFEIGLKGEIFDRRLRFATAVFLTDFTDQQVNVPIFGAGACLGAGFCSRTVNTGKSEMKGFELEFSALPFAGFRIDANYSYIDAEVKEAIDPAGNDIADQLVFIATPEHSFRVSPSFETTIPSVGRFSARLDVLWRDDIFFIARSANQDTFKGRERWLVNGRIGLAEIDLDKADTTLEVAIWGKNLTNEEYRIFGVDFGRFQNNAWGNPRTYGAEMILRF